MTDKKHDTSLLEIGKIYRVLLDDINKLSRGLLKAKKGWLVGKFGGIDVVENKLILFNALQMHIPIDTIEDIEEVTEDEASQSNVEFILGEK
jgi:hypothetical protein